MSERRWQKLDEDTSIAFEPGCNERGHARGRTWDLKCTGCGFEHGHVSIASDGDGTCWIPFPCASQEGVRTLLAHESKTWLKKEEMEAILALPEVLALPEALTDGERAIFQDPEKLSDFTKSIFASP